MFPCLRRTLIETSKLVIGAQCKFIPNVVKRDLHWTKSSVMAQRSITSFFKVTPPKNAEDKVKEAAVKEKKNGIKTENIKEERKSDTSPTTNSKEKRMSKRPRLNSSDSESGLTNSKVSPNVGSEKKKKPKRQRIESSGSESEPTDKQSSSPTRNGELSSNSEVNSDLESPKKEIIKVKVEKTDSPKTYASPRSKKGQPKILKEVHNSPKSEVKSPKTPKSKKSPIGSPSPKSIKKEKKEVISEGSDTEIKENILNKSVSKESESIDYDVTPVAETEYNPGKSSYHPIADACWLRGAPVPYLALAATFQAIEPVSARLKIIDTLSNYFRSVIALTPEDLLPSVYLCLNQLAPAYHSLELGIAETYLMKAVGACTGRTLAQLRAAARGPGGLGAAAEGARAAQRTMFPQPPLQLRKVFQALRDIAHMTGQSSVNKKIAKIQTLYIACRHSEARYLIRSLEGKLRIGLAEQSVLQALALAVARTPPAAGGASVLDAAKGVSQEAFKARLDEHALLIKTTYCECPNYEAVIPALLRHGAAALPAHCRLTPGVPLKPMLAHPTRGVHEVFSRFEGCSFTCEWKYDGERAQIHVPAAGAGAGCDLQKAAVFSRNQEDNTSKYPDIIRRLGGLLKDTVQDCVLDCEAVAYDTQTQQILPFQILSTRKRKDAVEGDIKVQVCVFVFDLLFLNGAALVRRPLRARRELLHAHFNEVPGEWQFATSKDCSSMEEVQTFLEESVRGSCEGLMVKALEGPTAHYDIARRSRNWLKLKKDYLDGVGDTLDVVIIGAYHGRGRRSATYGGFLAACRDPDTDTYQTLCKLGTGFSDEDLASLTETLKQHEIPQPKSYYSYDRSLEPDAWMEAACVWEVRCADLSLSPAHRAAIGLVEHDKGISLRFPRFVRVRDDKTPETATSARQVADLYLAQDQVRNAAPVTHHDDFY